MPVDFCPSCPRLNYRSPLQIAISLSALRPKPQKMDRVAVIFSVILSLSVLGNARHDPDSDLPAVKTRPETPDQTFIIVPIRGLPDEALDALRRGGISLRRPVHRFHHFHHQSDSGSGNPFPLRLRHKCGHHMGKRVEVPYGDDMIGFHGPVRVGSGSEVDVPQKEDEVEKTWVPTIPTREEEEIKKDKDSDLDDEEKKKEMHHHHRRHRHHHEEEEDEREEKEQGSVTKRFWDLVGRF